MINSLIRRIKEIQRIAGIATYLHSGCFLIAFSLFLVFLVFARTQSWTVIIITLAFLVLFIIAAIAVWIIFLILISKESKKIIVEDIFDLQLRKNMKRYKTVTFLCAFRGLFLIIVFNSRRKIRFLQEMIVDNEDLEN